MCVCLTQKREWKIWTWIAGLRAGSLLETGTYIPDWSICEGKHKRQRERSVCGGLD